MILGTASGIPVVACVATGDRWNHMLDCPYCGEVHSHGGHGPTSPAGAANGGRLAHCRVKLLADGQRWEGPGDVHPDGRFYVLMEVPGVATFGTSRDRERITRHVTYDLESMPDLDELLVGTIETYEAIWKGLDKRGPERPGFNYPPFLRREVSWTYAYYGRGKVPWDTKPFAEVAVPLNQILYRFFDGAGTLLYIGITGDAAVRWSNHRRDKEWWPLVRRFEIDPYATRAEVEAAETAAIKAERPRYNKVHNGGRRAKTSRSDVATDPQHYTDACHDCGMIGLPRGMHPAVQMDWQSDGVETLHQCDEGHQWTCSWGKNSFIYEDCDCDYCVARTKRPAA